MTPEEAATVLSYCADAWPTMTIGEDTAIVWADGLRGIDAHDARVAVRQLAQTDEWPPSLARVVAAARGVQKGRSERRALGWRPNPNAARIIAAISAASAAIDRPEHDHRRGAEHCPCCSTSAERVERFTVETMAVLREAGVVGG